LVFLAQAQTALAEEKELNESVFFSLRDFLDFRVAQTQTISARLSDRAQSRAVLVG
jgi:hypothetical protein